MIDHMAIGASIFASSQCLHDAALGISMIMEVTPQQSGRFCGIGHGVEGKSFF